MKAFNRTDGDRNVTQLLSETFLRLGEYYIVIKNKTSTNFDFKFDKCRNYIKTIEDGLPDGLPKILDTEKHATVFSLNEMSLSVKCLWYAAYLAKQAKDEQRETDSLQSIINALYFDNFTITDKNDIKNEERAILFLTGFGAYIRETLLGKGEDRKYRFPIVASKSLLVEGDLYFSWLFERETDNDNTKNEDKKFFVRACWNKETDALNNDQVDYKKTPNFKKSILHRMLYRYLSALNELTDPHKKYENYHFNNMLLELNRRILYIGEQKFVKNLVEDIRPIWDSFPNLISKREVLESLSFSLKVHEVGLGAAKILISKSVEQVPTEVKS